MKLLIAILFLFISCTPEEAPRTERHEQTSVEGEIEQRRIEREEQQGRAEREAEKRRIERAEQQRIAEKEAEERRVEREKQRTAESKAEEGGIERAEQQRTAEREEPAETHIETEAIYIISFFNVGLAPNSVELTVNGDTLRLNSDSFPACVALKQSELNALSIDVYTPTFLLLGKHLVVSALEECSCSNNRGAEIKPCTTESDNYNFTVSGGHFLGFINWECTFEVQTTDIPNASDCRKF